MAFLRNPHRDPFFDALAESLHGLALPPSEGAGGHRYLDRERQCAELADGGFDAVQAEVFTTERMLDAAAMRGLYASFSFVRLLPDADRHRLLDRIGDLVERRFGGAAPNVVLTPLYLGRRS
ncbi:hypothetical protein [Sphingomonas sp.]|uniref:hypothetical protein n=1 Tax=Sphingomonas sp. TaxID=28214 RepID=UPI0025EFF3B8|nr:hypothetical protein [Sphingomonas sp.]